MSDDTADEFAELERRLRNRRAGGASPQLNARIQGAVVRELAMGRADTALSGHWFAAAAAAAAVIFVNLGIITAPASTGLHRGGLSQAGARHAAAMVQELGIDLPPAETRRAAVMLAAAGDLVPLPLVQGRVPVSSALPQGDRP